MNSLHPQTLIIDGHTCSGKSTVAKTVAERLGRQYIKPFDGAIGRVNQYLAERQDWARLKVFRSSVIDCACADHRLKPTVFDRLHPSTLSLLPESEWPDQIAYGRQSVILWCDENVTLARLEQRGRNLWTLEQHRTFVKRFRTIAERYGILLIDTSSSTPTQTAERVMMDL